MREGLDSVNQWVTIHESTLLVVNYLVIIKKTETYIFICFKRALHINTTASEDIIQNVKQNLL